MSRIKIKIQYKTSDGMEFPSEEEAQKHEEIINAKNQYERAKLAYAKLVWQSQITADGKPFQFDLWHDYYYVHDFDPWPALVRVSFMRSGQYEFDENDEGVIQPKSKIRYRISELYYDRNTALHKVRELQRKVCREHLERLEDLG